MSMTRMDQEYEDNLTTELMECAGCKSLIEVVGLPSELADLRYVDLYCSRECEPTNGG